MPIKTKLTLVEIYINIHKQLSVIHLKCRGKKVIKKEIKSKRTTIA